VENGESKYFGGLTLLMRMNTARRHSSLLKVAAVFDLNRWQIGLIDLRTFQQTVGSQILLHAQEVGRIGTVKSAGIR